MDFLFSTLHTTPFLYAQIQLGILCLLLTNIATLDTPPITIVCIVTFLPMWNLCVNFSLNDVGALKKSMEHNMTLAAIIYPASLHDGVKFYGIVTSCCVRFFLPLFAVFFAEQLL